MKKAFFAIIILFSTITFGQEESTKTPKIVVKVSQGETVTLRGVKIKFLEVVEDSRCPQGVNCIWAGRAIIKTQITSNGNTEEKTLIFGETRPGEDKNTNLYTSSQFVINGLKLNPYPTSQSTGKDTGYVLMVCDENNM